MITFPILIDIYRQQDGRVTLVERISLTEPGSYSIGRLPESDVVLESVQASRSHAFLHATAEGIEVEDRDSKFGTFIGQRRIEREPWTGDAPVRIEPYEFHLVRSPSRPEPVRGQPGAPVPIPGSREHVTNPRTEIRASEKSAKEAEIAQSFPRSVLKGETVAMNDIRASGYLLRECDYLAIGGGLGSFTWVDSLRCFGVPKSAIIAIGVHQWDPNDPNDLPRPYENYSRLCSNSQIPGHERLRSNSISTPDNIWGFPGYASRETWRELKQFKFGGLRHILQVFGEPTTAETYTPRSGDVFRSLDREARRIGWRDICLGGRALSMRKTEDGRFAVAVRLQEEHARDGERDKIIVARHIQLATGYPAYRTEDDIFKFNQRHSEEKRAFKAYDPHDEVYYNLEHSRQPATVVIRGRGIVASRILQRLYEARARNNNIKIYHQVRTALGYNGGMKYRSARRPVFNHTEIQPFNWPKSCWGGDMRTLVQDAPPQQRSEILVRLGGTSTAERQDWQNIVLEGIAGGWYRVVAGRLDIKELTGPKENRKITMVYSGADASFPRETQVDYVIDCIGLIGDVANSAFLKDAIDTYRLPRNRDYTKKDQPQLGLEVTNDFELQGMRNGPGRVYASGQITGHGPFAAVDSFLGLQYCALRSVDHLNSLGAPNVSNFGPLKSFGQWIRWCTNSPP
jgi:pSer/pThr/pTyr-binding forkhead associated (FHA) protein